MKVRHLALTMLVLATLTGWAQTSQTNSFTNLNIPIPDGNWAGLADVRSITSTVTRMTGLSVRLTVIGEYNGDLYCYLRHITPATTNFCVLLNRVGRSAALTDGYADAGLDVTFADSAVNGNIHTYQLVTIPPAVSPLSGAWQPDGRRVDPASVFDASPVTTTLSSFAGADANGDWTLFIADLDSGGTNMLASWEVDITGAVTPPITWATPSDIAYGTALGSNQLNASAGSVSGTFVYNPPSGTVLSAGTHVLQAIFMPTDTVNYLPATNSVNINVTAAPLTITANNASKVYGDADPPFSVAYSGFVNGQTPAVLAGTLVFNRAAGENAGPYAITPSGLSSANYAITFKAGTLTITPAPLLITAVPKTKVYGAADPALTYGVSGLKLGDTAGAVLTGNLSRAPGEGVAGSPFAIMQGTLAVDANYTISFTASALTITPAALSITADNKTKAYGQADPAFTATYAGFLNGETPAVLGGSLVFSRAPGQNAGAYQITPSGLTSVNYAIAYHPGTLTITKAGSAGIVSVSQNPAKPGDSVNLTVTLSAVAPGTGTPTGAVQFRIDGAAAGSPAPLTGGVGTYTTSSLTVGTHSVAAEYPGDGNFQGTTNNLSSQLVINTPPVAGSVTIVRFGTNDVKVAVATLLSNDSDPDGDALTFVGVSATSTNQGTVTQQGSWISYTPPAGSTNNDSFAYMISDGHWLSVTGTVYVAVRLDTAPSPNLEIVNLNNGSYLIRFSGIPGLSYEIQYTDDVQTLNWTTLGAATADPFGSYEYVDTPPGGAPHRYYRSAYP